MKNVLFLGMDIINEALETAVNGKDKSDWTPVSVNVAPATLTILSKQVRQDAALRESGHLAIDYHTFIMST